MAWVWDSEHRRHAERSAAKPARRKLELMRFLDAVDVLYYLAAAALAACIIAVVAR